MMVMRNYFVPRVSDKCKRIDFFPFLLSNSGFFFGGSEVIFLKAKCLFNTGAASFIDMYENEITVCYRFGRLHALAGT